MYLSNFVRYILSDFVEFISRENSGVKSIYFQRDTNDERQERRLFTLKREERNTILAVPQRVQFPRPSAPCQSDNRGKRYRDEVARFDIENHTNDLCTCTHTHTHTYTHPLIIVPPSASANALTQLQHARNAFHRCATYITSILHARHDTNYAHTNPAKSRFYAKIVHGRRPRGRVRVTRGCVAPWPR